MGGTSVCYLVVCSGLTLKVLLTLLNPACATSLAKICAGLHHHTSPGDCARELFKPSKDSESLLDLLFKNWEVLDFCSFVSDVIFGVDLRIFCMPSSGPVRQRPNFLAQVFVGNYSL